MKKYKDLTKTVFDPFSSDQEKKVKISELCQYCPNESCEGFYRKDAKYACLTFKSWREGSLSLEHAIKIKYKQSKRHDKTDEYRDWVYDILVGNTDATEYAQDYMDNYESKSAAGDLATDLIKGKILPEEISKRVNKDGEYGLINIDKNQRLEIVKVLRELKDL